METKGKRINVHVGADEVPILERFKEAGGNVSGLLRRGLNSWLHLEKLKDGHSTIRLYMTYEKNKLFFGSWIWRELDDHGNVAAGVAHTRKGKFLHYWNHPGSDDGYPGGPEYKIYDSIDDFDDLPTRHRTEMMLTGSAADEEFLDI